MKIEKNRLLALIRESVKNVTEQYKRETHREMLDCPTAGYDKVQTLFGDKKMQDYIQGIELYAAANGLDIETFKHRDNLALPDRPQYGYDEIKDIRKVPRSVIVIGGPDGTKVGHCLRLPGNSISADPSFARADAVFIVASRFNAETGEKLTVLDKFIDDSGSYRY